MWITDWISCEVFVFVTETINDQMTLKADYVSATGCLFSLNKNEMCVASAHTNLSLTQKCSDILKFHSHIFSFVFFHLSFKLHQVKVFLLILDVVVKLSPDFCTFCLVPQSWFWWGFFCVQNNNLNISLSTSASHGGLSNSYS